MRKKLTISIVAVLLLLAGVSLGGGFYMIDYALRPANENLNQGATMEVMCRRYPHIRAWMDSIRHDGALRDTFITAADGMRLHAYFVSSRRPRKETAVIVHGYTDCAVRMFHIGYLYNESLDYNVLIPDLRFSGLSDGEAIQMGWLDRKDVMQWINMVPELFGDSAQVAVHGISMGAATTMMTSGERLPEYVKCFVEDCGYTSVWHQFQKELKEQFGLPAFPLLHVSSWLCSKTLGWNFCEASALEQIRKCSKPMMFVHGDADKYVPTYMVHELYEAKPAPKELWIVPQTAHAESYLNYPEEYTARVRSFMDRYMR